MREESLPLFPLPVVLFPGSALPLHIFEERYKLLIGECLQEIREFGINFVHSENVSEIGCTAAVLTVLRRYPDGRLDIVVRGNRRYQLLEYTDRNRPYLVGNIEYIEDGSEQPDTHLEAETISLYNTLVEIVYRSSVPPVTAGGGDRRMSFLLAQKSGLDLEQRQALLGMRSENERLSTLNTYFRTVIPKLKELEEVNRVIRGDGYL